jgi:hypothetical protein
MISPPSKHSGRYTGTGSVKYSHTGYIHFFNRHVIDIFMYLVPGALVPGTITSFYRYILDLRQDVLYQVPGTGVHRLFYGSGHDILIRNDVHTFSGDRYGDNIITIETLAFKGLPGPWYRTLLNFGLGHH